MNENVERAIDTTMATIEAHVGAPIPPMWEKHVRAAFAIWGLRFAEEVTKVEKLKEALQEYADHQSWRCQYRSRYERCRCGLDDALAALGMPPVMVQDPEAKS